MLKVAGDIYNFIMVYCATYRKGLKSTGKYILNLGRIFTPTCRNIW